MNTTNKDSAQQAQADVSLPYSASYSSKFEMGDPNHSKMILEIWSDWDNGNLMAHKDHFADSLQLYAANAPAQKGPRDSVLSAGQKARDMYTTVKTRLDAIVPLKSTDKNENWVALWGMETHTDKNGKTDSVYLQETWRINKNNKVDLLYQFDSNPVPPPNKK